MLDDYKKSQPIAYKIFKNALEKEKYSHAYIIETNHYPDKLNFVNSFIKGLLCPYHRTNSEKCVKCTQCNEIDDGNHIEVKYIRPDGMWIKKEQLIELQTSFSTKAINGGKRIYVIFESEKLNVSASNSILKFLEEPEEGIIAILLTDNVHQLLDTIISRCQIVSLNKVSQEAIEKQIECNNKTLLKTAMLVTETTEELQKFIEDEKNIINIEQVIEFVQQYEKYGQDISLKLEKLWFENFNDKESISVALEYMILYYYDSLNKKLNRKIEVFDNYENSFKNIVEKNTIMQLCHKLTILLESKEKLKVNANLNLLMDKLIIDLEEVNYA